MPSVEPHRPVAEEDAFGVRVELIMSRMLTFLLTYLLTYLRRAS